MIEEAIVWLVILCGWMGLLLIGGIFADALDRWYLRKDNYELKSGVVARKER